MCWLFPLLRLETSRDALSNCWAMGVHDAIENFGGYLGMVDMRNPLDLLDEGKL